MVGKVRRIKTGGRIEIVWLHGIRGRIRLPQGEIELVESEKEGGREREVGEGGGTKRK